MLSHANQYERFFFCTLLALNRAPRLYRLFGTITQGWVDLDEFDPLTFCRASLYNTWSLWALLVSKASSSVGRPPSIDMERLYWFP